MLDDQELALSNVYGYGLGEYAEIAAPKQFKIKLNKKKPYLVFKSKGASIEFDESFIAIHDTILTLPPCYRKITIKEEDSGRIEELKLDDTAKIAVADYYDYEEKHGYNYNLWQTVTGELKLEIYVGWDNDGDEWAVLPEESSYIIEFLDLKDTGETGSGETGESESSPSCPGLSEGSPEGSGGGPALVPAPSISYDLGLGKVGAETSAGKLLIAADTLTPGSFTPAILTYQETDGVEKILDGSGNIRQIYAPDTLANVITTDSDTFEIRFYATTGSESVDGSGYYIPVGSPLVTWKVDKITGSKMEVTKTEGAAVDSSTMEKIAGGWIVTSQGGDRVEELTWEDTTGMSGPNKLRKTRIVGDHRGMSPVLVSKVVTDYEEFDWGREQVAEAEDPDGANRVTEWTYYDDAVLTALLVGDPGEDPRFGKAYTQQSPDGSWIKYLAYNEEGTVTETLEGWKDITLSSGTVGNAKYTLTTDITNGIRTEVFLEGHLAKKYERFASYASTTNHTVREYSSSGAYLQTVTRIGEDGRIESISQADGRRDSYEIEEGTWNDGNSTFTEGSGGPAKRKTVKHGADGSPDGIANQSTWERTVTDAEGNTVLRETFVYTGSGTSLLTSVRSHYDADNQLTSQTSNGRTVLTQTWAAGKLQTSADEQGIVTTYTYDAYGRTATETRTGLVTTYSYDIEGRLESQETEPES